MRLVYAKDEFQKERASWPPIIHYNVLRMIVTVIRLVEDAISEQDAHPPTRPSASSDASRMNMDTFTNHHRVLCLKLKPLLEVEANMTKHLLQSLTRRPGEEVCVHSNFSWTKHFHPTRHSRADALKTEGKRVLNGSAATIMQLWNDPAVRRLLHEQAIQLEHEAGFFLDELERVTALDYEPTDCEPSLFFPRCRIARTAISTDNRLIFCFSGCMQGAIEDSGCNGDSTQSQGIPWFDRYRYRWFTNTKSCMETIF